MKTGKRDNLGYMDVQDVERLISHLAQKERQVLDEINQKVAAGQTLDVVMEFVFDAIRQVSHCDRVGLAFVEEQGQRVVAHWCRAAYEPILLKKGYAEDLRGSSLERVISLGAPRIINDLEAYLQDHPKSPSTRLIVKEGVRSSMTCPLAVDGRNVGLFFRSSRQKAAYDDTQIAMHLAMAERLSQAVEKAYRIEQLDQANKAYMELLGFASHELKNPLGSILADTYMLKEGYFGELNEEQRSKIDRIVQKTEYISGMVREYLDLARMESGSLRVRVQKEVDFWPEVAQFSMDLINPQLESQDCDLQVEKPDEPLLVDCDVDLMRIVLVNLLGNAVKYGNAGGQIRLVLSSKSDLLCVRVWNEGPGFSPSQKSQLFKKFSRLDSPELRKRKGTGVGLYTTWQIIQLHGGRIEADSKEGSWAEFRFRVPLRVGGGSEDGQEMNQ